MDRNKIVEELARNNTIRELIRNISKGKCQHPDDLEQDIYEILMTKPPERIETMYERNELNFWLARTITNQIWSLNSPYHYRYERWDERRTPITTDNIEDDAD